MCSRGVVECRLRRRRVTGSKDSGWDTRARFRGGGVAISHDDNDVYFFFPDVCGAISCVEYERRLAPENGFVGVDVFKDARPRETC